MLWAANQSNYLEKSNLKVIFLGLPCPTWAKERGGPLTQPGT
jgi:hypothetical protein